MEGKNIVKEYMERHDITKASVAKKLGISPQALGNRLSRVDMPVDFMLQVSEALNHNFFDDMSREYKRAHFNLKQVVAEPETKYSKITIEDLIREIVRDEIRQTK